MRDFMPCKGCGEPEACEIEGRCLEPRARMLTSEELAADHHEGRERIGNVPLADEGNVGVPEADPAQAFTEPGERRWSRVLAVLSEAMERAVRAFDTGTADDYSEACIAFDDAVSAELDRITTLSVKAPHSVDELMELVAQLRTAQMVDLPTLMGAIRAHAEQLAVGVTVRQSNQGEKA